MVGVKNSDVDPDPVGSGFIWVQWGESVLFYYKNQEKKKRKKLQRWTKLLDQLYLEVGEKLVQYAVGDQDLDSLHQGGRLLDR